MKISNMRAVAGLFLAAIATVVFAQPSENTVPVTADNFIRAESDLYFGNVVKQVGIGSFHHSRELLPIDKQTVIPRS
jgi:hypothetical protein